MTSRLLPTGDAGLDAILRGGLPEGGMHLVQAPPGAGKTTLALQFLLEGLRRGERGLYVTLSQTARELREVAASHGWDLSGLEIVELQAGDHITATEQTIFQTADLRLDQTREAIESAVERVEPKRMVYDSLLEVRLLTQDMPRYHRELMGLRAFVAPRGITVLLLDTGDSEQPPANTQVWGIVQGVVTMAKTLHAFGRARRRIEITKMRGVPIRDGWHDIDIRTGRGVCVFPRVVPDADHVGGSRDLSGIADPGDKPLIQSGIERLDEMFGGGVEAGTTTMLVGQAGTGKSTIAALYITAALNRGDRVALFLFDERLETFFRRCEGLGMGLREHVETGLLKVYDYSPDEVTAGEFSQIVQAEAETPGLGMVVIDSLTGYMSSLTDGAEAMFDVQSLMKYLSRRDISTFLIVAQRGLLSIGAGGTGFDLSFLGDMVLLLRLHEEDGTVRRSITPIKKRHGSHLKDVCELVVRPGAVEIGNARPGP